MVDMDWVLEPEVKISYYQDKESEACLAQLPTSSKEEGVMSTGHSGHLISTYAYSQPLGLWSTLEQKDSNRESWSRPLQLILPTE
jgi:hypothetical protein